MKILNNRERICLGLLNTIQCEGRCMVIKKYYNVHNLISFSIEGEEKKIAHLCKQCEYFLFDGIIENEDIIIKVGEFKSLLDVNKEYSIINRKYYVSNNIIFAEDHYKTAKWKMQMENIGKKQIRFFFDGNGWTKYILHKSFVEPLIRYKLNQIGIFMVHSSAVGIGNNGIVFPASPEAGKTSTMLNFLEMGSSFMADDFCIIGEDKIYAYPTPITLHSHNLKRHPFLVKILTKKEKRQIFWRTLVLKLTLGMGDISYKVDIWNKEINGKPISVAAETKMQKMILLTKYSGEKVKLNKISKQEMLERVLVVNYYETTLFDCYLKAYSYKNSIPVEEEFWNKMRNNIDKNLKSNFYYEICLPKRYTQKEFEAIVNSIKE